MGEVRDFPKNLCVYCGEAPHKVPLACPRIMMLHIDTETGCVSGITFWEEFYEEEEPTPAA
jgi:hypothetical protein